MVRDFWDTLYIFENKTHQHENCTVRYQYAFQLEAFFSCWSSLTRVFLLLHE